MSTMNRVIEFVKAYRKGIFEATVIASTIGALFLGNYPDDSNPPAPIALEQRLLSSNSTKEGPQKYAVLVSGLAEERFRDNLENVYRMLQKEGFKPENVFVLDYRGDKNNFYPVDGPASKKAVQEVFEYLSKKVTPQDDIVFWFDDHGSTIKKTIDGKIKELSTICLPGEDIDQKELADLASGLNPKQGIFVIDSCYSGGFASEMATMHKPFLTITATTDRETACTENVSVSKFLVEALSEPKLADKNKDGRTSAQEAFDYMLDKIYPVVQGKKYHPTSGPLSGDPQMKGSLDPEKTYFK